MTQSLRRSHARIHFEEIKHLYTTGQITAVCAVRLALISKRRPGSVLKIQNREEFYQSLGMARSTFYKALRDLKQHSQPGYRIEILYKRFSLELRYERIDELQLKLPLETASEPEPSTTAIPMEPSPDTTSNVSFSEEMIALGIDPNDKAVKTAVAAYPEEVKKALDYLKNYRSPIRNPNGFFLYRVTTTSTKQPRRNSYPESYTEQPDSGKSSPRTSQNPETPSGTGFAPKTPTKSTKSRGPVCVSPLEHQVVSQKTVKPALHLTPKPGDPRPAYIQDPEPGNLKDTLPIVSAMKAGDRDFALYRMEELISAGRKNELEEILYHHPEWNLAIVQNKILEIPDDLSDTLMAIKAKMQILGWDGQTVETFLLEHYNQRNTERLDDRQLLDLRLRLNC